VSATTQPKDFSDLYTELLNRTRSTTGVTAITNQAKRYINTGLYDFVIGFEHQLPWLERESSILTHAPYTTGTVSIADGSTALAGVGTLWNTANTYGQTNIRTTGRLLLGGGDIHTISSITNDTNLVLNERFIGTALSASTYTYFEDEYALASDFLKPLDWRVFSTARNVVIIGRHEFKRRFPRPLQAGNPKIAVLRDRGFSGSTTPIIRVQFHPHPGTTLLIPYSYITSNLAVSSAGVEAAQLSADSDEPNLPVGYRHLIVLNALYLWYRDKKDDARMQSAQADYVEGVSRVVGDTNVGMPKRAQFAPRVQSYEAYARQPYSGIASGRRYSHNNSFDYMEDEG
jgi:hypothetical protein